MYEIFFFNTNQAHSLYRSKGGVIKYETDRGGRDLKILLKNLVAQHKQQKEFPGPTVSSKKISWPPKIFSL